VEVRMPAKVIVSQSEKWSENSNADLLKVINLQKAQKDND